MEFQLLSMSLKFFLSSSESLRLFDFIGFSFFILSSTDFRDFLTVLISDCVMEEETFFNLLDLTGEFTLRSLTFEFRISLNRLKLYALISETGLFTASDVLLVDAATDS